MTIKKEIEYYRCVFPHVHTSEFLFGVKEMCSYIGLEKTIFTHVV